MKFQVCRDNIGMMSTEHINCIPSRTELIEMQRAGYKFRIDGKAATVPQICGIVESHKKMKD